MTLTFTDIFCGAGGSSTGLVAAGYVHGFLDGHGNPTIPCVPVVPFSSRDLSRAVGVEPPGEGVAHTALGDARWARDVYLAVTGGAS